MPNNWDSSSRHQWLSSEQSKAVFGLDEEDMTIRDISDDDKSCGLSSYATYHTRDRVTMYSATMDELFDQTYDSRKEAVAQP